MVVKFVVRLMKTKNLILKNGSLWKTGNEKRIFNTMISDEIYSDANKALEGSTTSNEAFRQFS